VVEPLALPSPEDYPAWLSGRAEGAFARVRTLADRLRGMAGASADDVLSLWNDIGIALADIGSPAGLLANVHPDAELRDSAEKADQEARRLATDLSLDRGIFDVLATVDTSGLDAAALRVLEQSLRDFRRSGVDRDEETRERVRVLAERQTEVGQRFSRNIREGVRRFRVDPARLDGLPEDFRDAHQPGDDGLVELTTDYPDYRPVMTFATDRALREEMLRAFLDRAWPDNDAVLHELLEIRRETADVLGYSGWPAYDAEVKMISTGPAIIEFVDRMAALGEQPAARDVALLLERLRQDRPDATTVDGVDKMYYAEVVRRERFEVDAQEVRRYLDFGKVRRGLLDVTGRLFGVRYVEVDVPAWHADVTTYDVVAADGGDRQGERLGRIHLDLHPRPGKYSHAAQFDLVPGVESRQLPEGVLVCNFPRGLMEHDQVTTLFHEFGHLLHHVLGGRQRWVRFSGVATEWDFVEAPSQMLEEWAWDHAVLSTFATDADGHAIPAPLVDRMRTADEFGKGAYVRTQMFYAAVSYVLHQEVPEDLTATVRQLQERYDVFGHVPETHFHASFGHLGGYSSAYYTYMWSLVIAKDLFSAFDADDLFSADVARRYRDRVLVPGGSRDAADLVEAFLGRPYSFDAFERWLSR
jgi:thimet oligopeptidase